MSSSKAALSPQRLTGAQSCRDVEPRGPENAKLMPAGVLAPIRLRALGNKQAQSPSQTSKCGQQHGSCSIQLASLSLHENTADFVTLPSLCLIIWARGGASNTMK